MLLKRSVAAAAVAGLMALAACGGGSGDNNSGSDLGNNAQGAGTAGEGQDPKAQAPAPAIDGATKGGTVNVISTLGQQTLDPTEAYFVQSTSILSGLVTRSLTQFVYRDGEMVLVPDLATDLGTPNKDFTEWKFTIRDGIKWEDGSDVSMDDFVFGIERTFDNWAPTSSAKNAPSGAFPTGPTWSRDYFVRKNDFNGPYSDPGGTCGCVTVSGRTLTIKMAKPFADMSYWGSFPAMGPIPADQAKKDPADYALHPWSTGPYMFDGKINVSHDWKLVRNPNWDPDTDPGRVAYPDEFDFKVDYGEGSVLDNLLIKDSGVGQTAVTPDNIAAPDMSDARDTGRLVTGPNPCTYFAYFDMDDPKLKDVQVRKALALSWPVEEEWLARGNTPGVTRIPGTTFMAPGVPGRQEYDPLGTGGTTPKPDEAKKILADAGATGTEIRLGYATDDPLRIDEMNAIKKGLEKGGFSVKPIAYANTDKLTEDIQDRQSDLNVRLQGWCSDWPSGLTWLVPSFKTGATSNYSYLEDPAIDKKMEEIQTLPADQQPEEWGKLDEKIMTDIIPGVNIGFGGYAGMHGSKIGGLNVDTTLGMPTYKDLWVKK